MELGLSRDQSFVHSKPKKTASLPRNCDVPPSGGGDLFGAAEDDEDEEGDEAVCAGASV